jgi:hypothetical protein
MINPQSLISFLRSVRHHECEFDLVFCLTAMKRGGVWSLEFGSSDTQ